MFGYPVLRSKPQRWITELRFGYPPLRNFPKSFWENSKFSQKFRGVSAPALYKNPAVTLFIEKGPFFMVKGPRAPQIPQGPPPPRPLPTGRGVVTANPRGRRGAGGGGGRVEFGERARPLDSEKKKPLFDENAF